MEDFRPTRIRVYRNGDAYFPGKKFVVNGKVYKNYEQFLLRLSDEVQLMTGAVRRLYDLESGTQVRRLDELGDGKIYVATGGEPYKKVEYKMVDDGGIPGGKSTGTLVAKRTETRQHTRRVTRSTGGLLTQDGGIPPTEKAIFQPNSKAYKIIVFENGEATNPGMKMILNYRNCRGFDKMLQHISSLFVLKTGQVRKLYDAETGKRIRTMQDIHPGHNIVAGSFEPFKRVQYPLVDLDKVNHTVKSKEPEQTKIVTFYPNGDSYHTGLTLTISKKRFPDLSRLMTTLNSQIQLVTGKIQKIHTFDGTRIQTIDEFEAHKGYVLVANDDPFIRVKYNIMAVKSQHGPMGLAGSTMHNEFFEKIRFLTDRPPRTRQPTNSTKDGTDGGDSQHAAGTASKPRTAAKSAAARRAHTASTVASHAGGAESEREDAARGGAASRPQTKTKKQPQQQQRRAGDGNDTDGEIHEDERIRGTRGPQDEVYEQQELKKLEGNKTKSVRIVNTGKDADQPAAAATKSASKLPVASPPQQGARTSAPAPAPAPTAAAAAAVAAAAAAPESKPQSPASKPQSPAPAESLPSPSLGKSKSRSMFKDKSQPQLPHSPDHVAA
ncbi:hypothetical protein BC831DRAFT_46103 [Entophlyctis helioformis]|nr:hypothetical protein BC831DRAFT_46103 [Entophlyctis helioformis]